VKLASFGPNTAPGRTPPRPLLWFILAVTLARLLAAALIPLTEDEAYYRLWAQSPQFGYFDHPPMIAWWIHAGVALVGDNALGVRLIPVLSTALTTWIVFDLAQRLGAAAATAMRAAVWFNATLIIGFGGILAVPDAADVPFWALTLWCLSRTGEDKPARWWLAAGAAAGLATISKYSALFLAPGVLLWMTITPGGFRWLRTPWPWLAGLIAAAIFSTNVAWNAGHGWVSFVKQFGRAAPGRLAPQYVAELILGQAVLLNPIIAGFAGRAFAGRWWRADASAPDLRLPIATCLPFMAYLLLHSLHDRVQAHWPVPLYPALALCAAVAADQIATGGWAARLRSLAAPLGLGLSAIALIYAALPATPWRLTGDPDGELRGWPAFDASVEQARLTHGAAWVGALSYGTAAQIAAGPAIKAPVAELIERERYPPGDRSWSADLTRPGLVIDLDRRMKLAELQGCFASVTPIGELTRGDLAAGGARYAMFVVAAPKGAVLQAGCFKPK
jgi:4-amino-4-deoxy-L-arabinose transferase-like glycosyltransferase